MQTETVKYEPNVEEEVNLTTTVPTVATETRTVRYETEGAKDQDENVIELVGSQIVSSRSKTIETVTVSGEGRHMHEPMQPMSMYWLRWTFFGCILFVHKQPFS